MNNITEEKCAACGYIYSKKTVTVQEIIFNIGYSPFVRIETGLDKLIAKEDTGESWDRDREVELLACPECHTVKFKYLY